MIFHGLVKRSFPVILLLGGLAGALLIAERLKPPFLHGGDLAQEYVMARAILAGVDPYLPLPELDERFMPVKSARPAHPTPHTPALALLAAPFGSIGYEGTVIAWLLVELACLLATAWLLARWWGAPSNALWIVALAWAALGWSPVWVGFTIKQFSFLFVLLLLASWLALREGRDAWGGAMLGALMALKLMGWPLILFLIARRRWRGVIAAGGVAIAAQVAAGATIGFGTVADYYLDVGPFVSSFYRDAHYNFSAWTFGARLFAGTDGIAAMPLWNAPALAQWSAWVAPLFILLAGLALALRAKSFDTAFAVLVCAGLLANPVMWLHYLSLAAIPAAIAMHRLWKAGFPRKATLAALACWFLLSFPFYLVEGVIRRFFVVAITPDGKWIIPFAAGLLTLMPAIAVTGWMWLVWQSERIAPDRSRIDADTVLLLWLLVSLPPVIFIVVNLLIGGKALLA